MPDIPTPPLANAYAAAARYTYRCTPLPCRNGDPPAARFSFLIILPQNQRVRNTYFKNKPRRSRFFLRIFPVFVGERYHMAAFFARPSSGGNARPHSVPDSEADEKKALFRKYEQIRKSFCNACNKIDKTRKIWYYNLALRRR